MGAQFFQTVFALVRIFTCINITQDTFNAGAENTGLLMASFFYWNGSLEHLIGCGMLLVCPSCGFSSCFFPSQISHTLNLSFFFFNCRWQIRTIAIIAEGIPEAKTRQLNQKAKELGVTIIGPATVSTIWKSSSFVLVNLSEDNFSEHQII